MKHYVYGNGESRKGFGAERYDGVSWGCNAIYRNYQVDNLVVMDYGLQGEVYESGIQKMYRCYFADWNVIPSDPMLLETLSKNFKKDQIFTYGVDKGKCVVNGSDPKVVEKKLEEIKKLNPNIDIEDLRIKFTKELGLHIIYVDDIGDLITPITDPKEWSAGTTAIHLACQDDGCTEVYMFGFDISSYDGSINNIYKGSKHYLPGNAKGVNPSNWRQQLYMTFREFSKIKFNWVGKDENSFTFIEKSKIMDCPNVKLITYDNIRL